MLISVAQLLQRARFVLQDDAGVRWPDSELKVYCLDGQVSIVDAAPWMSEQIYYMTHLLAAGVEQRISEYGPRPVSRVLDVTTNMTDGDAIAKSIRKTSKDQMDRQRPSWATEAASGTILNWMPMEQQQQQFLVYPPAINGTRVRAQIVLVPTDIEACDLRDGARDALVYYIIHKAWSKDADYSVGSAKYKEMYDAELKRLIGANEIGAEAVHNRSRPK